MPAGDIKISKLKIGDIDLTDPKQAGTAGFEIYEDILSITGPYAEIQVVDHSDALGKTNLNGSYDKDVEIAFSLADGGSNASFKFKMMQNKNMSEGATEKQGSGHNKQYSIRCCSPEMLNAQGNFVKKSYEDQTSKMVEDILKNNFKTDKSVDAETTFGSRRFMFSNEHPLSALKRLNSEHVSDENKSSAFVLFQQCDGGSQKYVFSTFEKLFKAGSVVTLTQNATLGSSSASESDKQNSIRWIKVPDSFNTPTRSLSKAQQTTYDPTTGTGDQVDQKKQKFTFADKNGTYDEAPSTATAVPVHTMNDAANNKSATKLADARKNRLDYVSHLSQNHGTLEVYGNPAIKLGSIVTLEIPNRSGGSNSGEKQFNGKALVVSIKHKIAPLGASPRYTMILGVVKGSYKEGGGGGG